MTKYSRWFLLFC